MTLVFARAKGIRRAIAAGALVAIVALTGVTLVVAGDLTKPQKAFIESKIVKSRACVTCHAVGGSGGTVGPKLDYVGLRRDADWLRTWLKEPKAIRPATLMPTFPFSDKEIDELAALLSALREDVDARGIMAGNNTDTEKGHKLFVGYDCYACHRVGDEGRFIGPDLTWLGHRRTPEWESAWLAAPEAVEPGTFMPNFQFPDDERAALVAYLMSLRGQENAKAQEWEMNRAFQLGSRPREIGENIYRRFGCDGCHGRTGEGGYRNPNAAANGLMPPINRTALDNTIDQFKEILASSRAPEKIDTDGADPLPCPRWDDAITADEIVALYAFLESIAPKS